MSDGGHRRGSLLVIFLTVFVDLLGFGIVLPLLPIYADQLKPQNPGLTLGLLMASFSAMQFIFSPLWGRLSDRIGRRPVLIVGLVGSTLSYLIFGLATAYQSLTWMFISRIGAGIAGATISTAQAYIADTTTKEKRARGMALIGAAFGLGFTFGPLLAATALVTAGEEALSPWPGFTASAFSAAALMLAIFKLPESLNPQSVPSQRGWFDLASLNEALRIPTIVGLLSAWFVSVLAFSTFESILFFILKEPIDEGGFGYELIDVLLIGALIGFVHALAQGMVRGLSKRMSEAKLATVGAGTSLVGFLLLVAATGNLSLGMLLFAIFVQAAGFAFIPPTIQSLISRRSDPSKQGGILGVGQSLGALARILGHGLSFPLFFITSTIPFWAGAALMGLALVLIALNANRGEDFRTVER
ncbi:MAG: MFS transporter [Planctomycetaceae bacterium]